MERSAGSKMWDLDGNEYIDMIMGFGANLFGHSPPFIVEAIREQLDKGMEIGPQLALAAQAARLMVELTGQDRAVFCNTGSEAVLGAMRLARTVTGRETIAVFNNSYHGIFDEVVSRGTKKLTTIPGRAGHSQGLGGEPPDPGLRRPGEPGDSAGQGPRAGRDHGRAGPEPGPGPPAPGISAGPEAYNRGLWRGPDLRRGHHRVPVPPRRGPGLVRGQGRSGHLRQDHGRRNAHRRHHRRSPVHGRTGRRAVAVRGRLLPPRWG